MFYIHNVAGRLRVRGEVFKKNFGSVDEIRKALSTLNGIGTVNFNLTTGSILIHYNSAMLTHRDILALLETRGYFDRSKAITSDEYWKGMVGKVMEIVLMSSVELLLL